MNFMKQLIFSVNQRNTHFAKTSRHLKIDSEFALHKTCGKFKKLWCFIKTRLVEKGISPKDIDINELEILWQIAKNKET